MTNDELVEFLRNGISSAFNIPLPEVTNDVVLGYLQRMCKDAAEGMQLRVNAQSGVDLVAE